MIPPQNTITTVTLNTTTQNQNTTTLPSIFNLTSQLIGITIGATARKSNQQNNATSNVNTEGEHFSHFRTVRANPFEGFGAFGGGNNNNPPLGNNNGNNLPSGKNAEGLNPNVIALINALTEANLGINYVERESNHIKLIEFRGTEAEDFNE